MTVIKICDYFLKTNLNSYDAGELIESKIIDSVVENGHQVVAGFAIRPRARRIAH